MMAKPKDRFMVWTLGGLVLLLITVFLTYILISRDDSTPDDGDSFYQNLTGFECIEVDKSHKSILLNVSFKMCSKLCNHIKCECLNYATNEIFTGYSSCSIFSYARIIKSKKKKHVAFKRISPRPTNIDVSLKVHSNIIAKSSDDFRMVGVNFDFWPSSKPKWKKSGALEIDLDNKRLITLAKGLSGSMLRMGGSPADMLLYETYLNACSKENLDKTQKHGQGYYCPIWDHVRGQCLTMDRWKKLNLFAKNTGLKIAFDLNACWGRKRSSGEMDFTMIEGLIRQTSQGIGNWEQVYAFEFGNELYNNVAPNRYAADMKQIKSLLKKYWGNKNATLPKLVGPDCGAGSLRNSYLEKMLKTAEGNKTLEAVTIHLYGQHGSCHRNLVVPGFVLNVTCMDSLVDKMKMYKKTTDKYGTALWCGEGALHSNSGRAGLTNVFTSSFWYLNTLGSFAEAGIGLFNRQTLVGGDYELVDKKTFTPNPDYWVLLLWYRLSGMSALQSDWLMCGNECSNCLRTYSRSSLQRRKLTIIINFCLQKSFSVDIIRDDGENEPNANYVNIYQLTAIPSSRVIKLNGQELIYDGSENLPDLNPYINPATCKVDIPLGSITFVDF